MLGSQRNKNDHNYSYEEVFAAAEAFVLDKDKYSACYLF
jgi:hypothetical protein